MSEPQAPIPIEYATAVRTIRPLSLRAAKWVFGLTFVPPVVGLLILGGFWFTGYDNLTVAGFVWLFVGGAMTLGLGVAALANSIRAMARKTGESMVTQFYGAACLVALATLGVAYFCLYLGGTLMDQPHLHLVVTNATPTRIDRVVVHFTSGDVPLGPIAPGQQVSSGLLWPHHTRGPLYITTTVGSLSRKIIDQQPIDDFALRFAHGVNGQRAVFPVVVEPRELPFARPTSHPAGQP